MQRELQTFTGHEDGTFINNYATVYFSNLRENFPENSHGTCSFVSLAMVLSYFDCCCDNNYVDDKYMAPTVFAGDEGEGRGLKWAPTYSVESPGVTSEPLFDVENLSSPDYADYVSDHANEFLQCKLLSIWSKMAGGLRPNEEANLQGLSLYDQTRLAMYYLIYERGITSNSAIVTTSNATTNNEMVKYIVDNITDGVPVIIDAFSSKVGNHSFVAYDYDERSGQIYVHPGWRIPEVGALTHVSLSQIGITISNIENAYAIVPQGGNQNTCVGHYIVKESSGETLAIPTNYFVYPKNIRQTTQAFYDVAPTIRWDSLFNEKWYCNYSPFFNVTIRNHRGQIVCQDVVNDGCEYTIPLNVWQLLNSGTYYKNYSIDLVLTSDTITFLENLLSFEGTTSDQPSSFTPKTIKPSDFDGFTKNYDADDAAKSTFLTHKTDEGLLFKTRRYRARLNGTNELVISPKGYGFKEAFIEFQFFVPINRIDIDLSHWRDTATEGLTSKNGKAVIEEFRYNSYDDSNPILDLLSEETQLPTNREEKETYKLCFSKPVTRIRLYAMTFSISRAKQNRGRICVGNIKVYEDQSYKDPQYVDMKTTGSEPEYNPLVWNKPNIIDFNNCYSYAINWLAEESWQRMDPGLPAGGDALETLVERDPSRMVNYFRKNFIELAVCADSAPGILSEYGFIFEELADKEVEICDGGYRVALVLDEEPKNLDYHWYRQNPDGTWSHKPGSAEVRNFDFLGNPIMDPAYCDRRSGLSIESEKSGSFDHVYSSSVSYYSLKWNTEETEYPDGYFVNNWLGKL